MEGLKRHAREGRRRAAEELAPLARRGFGANLVALADAPPRAVALRRERRG